MICAQDCAYLIIGPYFSTYVSGVFSWLRNCVRICIFKIDIFNLPHPNHQTHTSSYFHLYFPKKTVCEFFLDGVGHYGFYFASLRFLTAFGIFLNDSLHMFSSFIVSEAFANLLILLAFLKQIMLELVSSKSNPSLAFSES